MYRKGYATFIVILLTAVGISVCLFALESSTVQRLLNIRRVHTMQRKFDLDTSIRMLIYDNNDFRDYIKSEALLYANNRSGYIHKKKSFEADTHTIEGSLRFESNSGLRFIFELEKYKNESLFNNSIEGNVFAYPLETGDLCLLDSNNRSLDDILALEQLLQDLKEDISPNSFSGTCFIFLTNPKRVILTGRSYSTRKLLAETELGFREYKISKNHNIIIINSNEEMIDFTIDLGNDFATKQEGLIYTEGCDINITSNMYLNGLFIINKGNIYTGDSIVNIIGKVISLDPIILNENVEINYSAYELLKNIKYLPRLIEPEVDKVNKK